MSATADGSADLTVAVVAAAATVIVAVVSGLIAYLAAKRDRRRKLYGEATKAALAWNEMLYRVRRRAGGEDSARALIDMFHSRQDELSYCQGWIGSESKYMDRSYRRFVTAVKQTTEPLIIQAWDDDTRPSPGNAKPDDVHPNLDPFADSFLADVRSHLSSMPWRKIAIAWRNRSSRD